MMSALWLISRHGLFKSRLIQGNDLNVLNGLNDLNA